METKSRYEVISELEAKKRALIQEKNGLGDALANMEKKLRLLKREKDDEIRNMDRAIEDMTDDIARFQQTMKEKEATITDLIASVDDSLSRMNTIPSTSQSQKK